MGNPQSAPDANTQGRRWSGKTRGGVLGNWIFVTLIRGVGLYPAYALLIFVAGYFVLCAPAARRSSERYLARVGVVSGSLLSRCTGTFRHFYAFGVTLMDRVAVLSGLTEKFSFDFEGEAEINAALAEGNGLMLLGAHIGNWEIAAQLLAGLDMPVNILMYDAEHERVREMMSDVLRERKWKLILADGSGNETFEALAALRRGEIVAVLADRVVHDTEKGTQVMPFLGDDAQFPVGPHLLAAAAGAGIIHAFAMRTRLFHYRFHVYPAVYPSMPPREERRRALDPCMELFVSRVEDLVRAYPLQWNNFYDFWRDDVR